MHAIEVAAEIVGIRDIELFILQVGRIRAWFNDNEE